MHPRTAAPGDHRGTEGQRSAGPHAKTRSLHTIGFACRGQSLPSDSSLDLISDKPNRWNIEGEPTVYLSGDPGLALVESGRHPDDLEEHIRLLEVDVGLPLVVDLRDRELRIALSLPEDLDWVLDREETRQVARSLRHSGVCDGLIVPSAGSLDQPDRFNIVVFADQRPKVTRMVTNLRLVGTVSIEIARSKVAGAVPR
jgi:RES domain-containing protein